MRSEGIHPRVFFGASGMKKNTCAPRSNSRLLRAKEGIERHIEQNPKDKAAQARLANLLARIR